MLEDRSLIKSLINMRDDNAIVIPLYVQIYGTRYPILELDNIKKRFSPPMFKIGYGTSDGLFMKNSFPTQRINEFDLIESFSEYDSENGMNIRYTVFESGDMDVVEGDILGEEIHKYFNLLFNNVKEKVDTYFKSLIELDSVPIAPREVVGEEVQRHIPVIDECDDTEDLPYPSIDDEYDEYTSIEDYCSNPLEELKKDVYEYSQDDEDNNLLIVETDNTGTEIVSATEVSLDLSKDVEIDNEVNDDYLSEGDRYPRVTEGGIIGKETVDFINGEGEYSDYNDYSTDFDIF